MTLRVTANQARVLQHNTEGGAEDVTPKRPRRSEEQEAQEDLFERTLRMEHACESLRWVFSTLNGVFLAPSVLRRARRAGMRRGILDVWVPIRRGEYCGLAMDLKSSKGRPTPEQLAWALHLVANGWLVCFPVGARDAWQVLCCYLGLAGSAHSALDWIPRGEMEERA